VVSGEWVINWQKWEIFLILKVCISNILGMKQKLFLFGTVLLSMTVVFSCSSDKAILTEQEQRVYIKRGDSLAKLTFDTLRKTLMRKILSDGVPGAVSFCQVFAGDLTATYTNEGVEISRKQARQPFLQHT
jgi:hypothetical protein